MELLLAIAIMALGALVLGAALGYASIKFKVEGNPLVEKIEGILPQTQCGQCGYPGCKPYAEAIAKGEADINLCPPGGMEGVQKLADLLGREVKLADALAEGGVGRHRQPDGPARIANHPPDLGVEEAAIETGGFHRADLLGQTAFHAAGLGRAGKDDEMALHRP